MHRDVGLIPRSWLGERHRSSRTPRLGPNHFENWRVAERTWQTGIAERFSLYHFYLASRPHNTANNQTLIAGRVRINQCVAGALVLGAGGALLARAFA